MRLTLTAVAILALTFIWTVVRSAPAAPSLSAHAEQSVDLEPCVAFGGIEALCGSLPVPEDPQNADGRTIDLAITVLPATGPATEKAADPIVGLHGGPGAAARFLAPVFAGIPARANRDVILVDQRGTGQSNGMACATEDAAEWMVLSLRFQLDTADCPDFDADPSLYTTPIAMDDLDRVREAMGFEQINLWGGSYGARAALVYMRRHPERIRSVVLDGVAPPSLHVPAEFPRTSQRALDLLLEDCRADEHCAARGDLAAMLDETFDRLAEAPAEVTVPFPGEPQPVTIPFGRLDLAASILYGLYNPFTAATIPNAISAAHQQNYTPAAVLAATFAAAIRPTFSMGMTLSVLCAEDAPYFTEAEMDADAEGTFLGPTFADGLHDACDAWPSGSVPAGYHDAIVSDIPTLLLSGETDPVTPPEFGDEAAATLSNSVHLVFPEMGHGMTGSPCGSRVVSAFIAAGSGEGLDGSCVTNVRRPSFTR